MIDPVNPNQNQQNSANNQTPAAPQAPASDQQVFNSVNVGGASSAKPEVGPVVDTAVSEKQDFETAPVVESAGEFVDPNVGGEVKDMVKVKKDFPDLDSGAKSAGVTETIPTGPVYGNFPASLQAAQAQYDEKPASSSDKWRALEAIKNFGRNLLGQTNPSEA